VIKGLLFLSFVSPLFLLEGVISFTLLYPFILRKSSILSAKFTLRKLTFAAILLQVKK